MLEKKKGSKEIIFKVPRLQHLPLRVFKAASVTIPYVFLPSKFKVSMKKIANQAQIIVNAMVININLGS
ncbi:MAG: hypothetical protein D6785_13125 [Planctomycetota bacterium]|nr:MAG: hypothetical protein D6785_13125 [Planctomycetota bacterium]